MVAPLRTLLLACLTGAVCLLPAEAAAQRRADTGATGPRAIGAAAPRAIGAAAWLDSVTAAVLDSGVAASPDNVMRYSDGRMAAALPDTVIHYSDGRMASAGFVGGVLGAVAGGATLGPLIGGDDCRGICDLGALVVGAMIGEAIGLATGVHLGNGSQGSWAATTVGSGGVMALGLLVAAMADAPQVLFVVPLAQLMAATRIQRFTMPDDGG